MGSLTLVIGNKNYSSWSLRPWLLLKHLGLNFEEILIPLYRPDSSEKIRQYSPAGKVPVLLDAELVIWDSLAIGEYLHEKFPQAHILPKDPAQRAYCRSIVAEMHSGFLNLRSNLSMNCRRQIRLGEIQETVVSEIRRIDAIWSQCLTKSEGPFLFGSFSLADAFYAPVALRFWTYGIELSQAASQYRDTILKLPEIQEWIEAAKKEPYTIEKFEK